MFLVLSNSHLQYVENSNYHWKNIRVRQSRATSTPSFKSPADSPSFLGTLRHSPADDLLVLSPDEMLLFGGQDAKGELLPCPALAIHHVCALVHVDGALRQGGGLDGEKKKKDLEKGKKAFILFFSSAVFSRRPQMPSGQEASHNRAT